MIQRRAKSLLWLLLAVPAVTMVLALTRGSALAMDLLHPSGEWAVRLMILALLPGPLSEWFGPNTFLRGWVAVRRNLGVAACTYALLHLAFYIVDMGQFAAILDELTLPAIWTGWLALALLLVPAAISFDAAMRALRQRWKALQRLAYPALALTAAHWLLLDWEWQPAAIHVTPLIIAWTLRALAKHRRANPIRSTV